MDSTLDFFSLSFIMLTTAIYRAKEQATKKEEKI